MRMGELLPDYIFLALDPDQEPSRNSSKRPSARTRSNHSQMAIRRESRSISAVAVLYWARTRHAQVVFIPRSATDADSESPFRIRFHRSRRQRRAAAGRRAGRVAADRADLVERAAAGRRRIRRRRVLGGDQAQGRQRGVASQRRLLQPGEDGAAALRRGHVGEQVERGKFVLLNMDAPHHTHLRKIISRGFTPRAIEHLRADLPSAHARS